MGTWPKPATSKLSLLVRSVKGTGSAAARAAAAGEAGEPSDGGRSCIGASAVGAVGGGIHRCGSLRGAGRRLWTDRSSAGGVQVGRSTVKRASARTQRLIRVGTSVGPAAVPASVVRAVRDAGSAREVGSTPHLHFGFGCRRSSIASIAKNLSLASTHQSVTSVKPAPSRSRRETSEPHAMRACAMAPLAPCLRQID